MIRPSSNKSLSVALAAVLMMSGASIAAAQSTMSKDKTTTGSAASSASELKLTSDQEKKLWTEISGHAMKQSAPSGFTPAVGQTVPTGVTLRELPSKAQTDVPAAKPYHYAMVQDKLLLVNPSDKKIVEVITE